jgi:quinol monooxygenase YgiN
MAIAVRISPKQCTREDYERIMAELAQDGHSDPEGRITHTSFGDDEVEIFETWQSHDHFEPYHDRMVTAMQAAGCDAGLVVSTDPGHRHVD